MHPAVEIILARMKSNPEDFVYERGAGPTDWADILNKYSHVFTEEERNAIDNEFKNVNAYERNSRLDQCLEDIYKVMAGDNNSEVNERGLLRGPSLHGRSKKIRMQSSTATQQFLESGLDSFFKEEYNNASRS